MNLTDKLRQELKSPLGRVVQSYEDPSMFETVVCVGDRASTTLIEQGAKPKIIVYDGYTMRKPIEIPESINNFKGTYHELENTPGTLNPEVFKLIEEALVEEDSTKIFIKGEEDLVTLAAIQVMPEGSLVIYGQPNEGMVYVEVNVDIKNKVDSMLEEMKDAN